MAANGKGIIYVKFDRHGIDKALDLTAAQIARANELLLSDVKHRVPGKISDAVTKLYNVDKSYVMALKPHKITEESTGNVSYTRGRNSGKGNVRFHSGGDFSSMLGASSKSLTFHFSSASNAYWPTMKIPFHKKKLLASQKRKWAHRRAEKVWQKAPEAYGVKVTTFKKKPIKWYSNEKYRAFAVPSFNDAGKIRLALSRRGERSFLVPKTSSIPQAILNPDVIAIWQPASSALIIKRWNNIVKQLRRKSI